MAREKSDMHNLYFEAGEGNGQLDAWQRVPSTKWENHVGRKWVRKENVFNETCLSKKDEYQLVSFLTFSNYDIIEVEMGLNIYEFIHDNSIKGNFPPEFLNTIQILYILKTNYLHTIFIFVRNLKKVCLKRLIYHLFPREHTVQYMIFGRKTFFIIAEYIINWLSLITETIKISWSHPIKMMRTRRRGVWENCTFLQHHVRCRHIINVNVWFGNSIAASK